MKYVKAVAVCAMVALGVGATGAMAQSLITSANIDNGTIRMRDLTPALQAKVKESDTPGPKGDTGAAGASGAQGAAGQAGANGRDGVRYDRLTGTCDTDPAAKPGEVAIAGGVARLGVPESLSWAQIRRYPQDLKLKEIENLSFRSNSNDTSGIVYLKVTTEGGGSVLFSPNTQPDGETGVSEWATHDVLHSTVRFNDDRGDHTDIAWDEALALAGDQQVKEVRVTAGCANPVGDDGGLVQIDDLTVNNEVIDFG